MFQLHIKKFLRNKAAIAALLITICMGMASVFTGKAFLQKQYRAIDAAAQYQKEHIARLVKYENKEFGLLMYYLKFVYVNQPIPITALAIGQRDVNSSIQSVTIRGLEAQQYDTDLQNPFNLMMGNLDLSFVVLYIFPLLIITLTFNALSEEKENGTWRLVYTQTNSPLSYLLQKILVAGMFAILALLLIFVGSLAIISLPFNTVLLQFAGISFMYILFWLAVSLFIVSFNKKSGTNAISLLSIWLLLTIVLPAAVNNFISTRYPVPEALGTMLKQRDGYHQKWDLPKAQTMQQFFKVYPQFKNETWQQDGFDWLWYYAMQHCGDVDAQKDKAAFLKKLAQRNAASHAAAWFIPSVQVQLLHNELTQSSLGNYINFLDSTTAFHEKLRLYFYPKIFAAAPVLQENWSKYQVVYHLNLHPTTTAWGFVRLFAFMLLPLMFGLINLKRINH
jgi:ABC-2 type transport system permease protein